MSPPPPPALAQPVALIDLRSTPDPVDSGVGHDEEEDDEVQIIAPLHDITNAVTPAVGVKRKAAPAFAPVTINVKGQANKKPRKGASLGGGKMKVANIQQFFLAGK